MAVKATVFDPRRRMVRRQIAGRGIADRRVLAAMEKVPRTASNGLLISGKWQGVELAALVCSHLAPFVADPDRHAVLAGPSTST